MSFGGQELYHEMDDGQLAMQQIIEDRQRRADEIATRIELGLATTDDAGWIRAEYGIPARRAAPVGDSRQAA